MHETLDQVRDFSDQIRSGKLRGATGKLLTNIVAVGIGGSYLGPEFVHEVGVPLAACCWSCGHLPRWHRRARRLYTLKRLDFNLSFRVGLKPSCFLRNSVFASFWIRGQGRDLRFMCIAAFGACVWCPRAFLDIPGIIEACSRDAGLFADLLAPPLTAF